MAGITIKRFFTKKGGDPFALFEYEKRDSVIKNPDGSVVFEIKGVEVPKHWSQLATDILAQKYIRKTGVPQKDENGELLTDDQGAPITGPETSIKQVVHRLAGTWRHWGEKHGYFASEEDAQAFYDELVYLLLDQRAAPNSPQWFNTGLAWAYNIRGESQGHWYVDEESGQLRQSEDAYTRPQPHACFIQSLRDDLVNKGGIFDLLRREALVFKYGSGSGSNFSALRGRGEPLSGGGAGSGLMSFLKVFDSGAGAIKSGGTTRRAAKMVCLDMDHPEIETFIMWKYREEQKVADLVTGSFVNRLLLQRVADTARDNPDWKKNKELKEAIREARRFGVSSNYIFRLLQLAEQGIHDPDFILFDTHYEGEAYQTVSGQNANNSIRVPNEFFEALDRDGDWVLTKRTDGGEWSRIKARALWNKVCLAAWHSADPGVQFDTTINEWHTCLKDGRIRASNPCSEYMFLDDTACNLASINIGKFLGDDGLFDIRGFRHASRLLTIVLEISVLMAQFVSEEMARKSYEYRTLGLGYANMGSTLMRLGIPFGSDDALSFIGAVTALMTGEAYAASAELAAIKGPFVRYEANKETMMRVIRNHQRAANNRPPEEYEGLSITPLGLQDHDAFQPIIEEARAAWKEAFEKGEKHGFRNAQVTLLAPTGTIGLVMDCDTTGIEPDFALVKFKKLAGGGYFKIINQSVPRALKKLGYTKEQIDGIVAYAVGHATLKGAPAINHETLKAKGFSDELLEKVESQLKSSFDIRFIFSSHTLGKSGLAQLKIEEEEASKPGFDLLSHLGFSKEEIEQANEYVCGTMTVEGAPFLKDEHLPVFDCASRCGKKGTRLLPVEAHIKSMAAAQPFLSGAISKTINMPNEATIKDIDAAYRTSWKLMLKANALYRDGSKLSQPLNTIIEDASLFEDESSVEGVQQAIAARHPGTPEWEGVARVVKIATTPLKLSTSEYEDGTIGRVSLSVEGASEDYQGLLSAYGELLAFCLSRGFPLSELVERFTFASFPPGGPVHGDPGIRNATSIVDYLYRVLGFEYLGRKELLHVEADPSRKRAERKKRELSEEEALIAEAKSKGYTGERCPGCGSLRLKRNGTCMLCEDCGSTTGCS